MEFSLNKYYYKSEDLFKRLPSDELAHLEKSIQQKSIRKKKMLFKQGSHPAGVYILTKGKIKMYQSNPGDRETIIYFYTAGDVMGYRPMICQETHPLSAAALEDCSYLFIPREAFLKILKQSPSLSNLLLETLGHEFSVWVSSMSFFASQRVKERIVLALLKLHEIYRPEDGGKVIIRLNRTDFAGYVGTAKETLVRVLGELKKKNIIASEGSKIRITDREALIGMLR